MNNTIRPEEAFYEELENSQDDAQLGIALSNFCSLDAVEQQIIEQRLGMDSAFPWNEDFLVPIKMR